MKKNIFNIILVAAAAFLLASCNTNVENNEKYQLLQSRVDSLNRANKQLQTNYNETLDMLNEIETGFNEISAAESTLLALSLENQGDTVSRKDQIINRMDKVKDKIEQQQQKIDNLQAQLTKSNARNKTLNATISRMQQQLDEKSAVIADLQRTVTSQRDRINQLDNTVASLQKDVKGLQDKSADQQQTIKKQDENMNSVHYICGTEAELIEWGLFSKNGIFDAGKLGDLAGTAADFKSFDRRRVAKVPTNGKRIKLLTNHPENSYTIEIEDDGTESIVITDRDNFWSISRYLVVRVKR